MTLKPGVRLGRYEVRSWLGAGGMGEVYLAADTRLGRPVAGKVLPSAVAATPARRKRWAREARVISALNHPHICALFDAGEHEGLPFLVMEYLEGETLSHRLARGPLAVDDAVDHARAIAGALSHAHREGIIHRDLKPANIMLTPSGAKLLDFGLAALQTPHPADESGSARAAVRTDTITEDGTILGTVNYMAPEQLEAKPIDARADIFAFGAVLYEMLTGQRAFDGDSKAGTIAAVLDREPRPISLVRRERRPADDAVPSVLESIVARCLVKSADDRWQSTRDLLAALSLPLGAVPRGGPTMAAAVSRGRLATAGWAAALLAGAAAIAVTAPAMFKSTDAPSIQFLVPPPEGLAFNRSNAFMTISPDGRMLAFSASAANGPPALWIRALDSTVVRQLPGTDGGVLPFWSADSLSIAFTASDTLKAIEVATGRVRSLGAGTMAGAWNAENVILARRQFAGPEGQILLRISATSGEVRPATAANLRASAPAFLPDGRHFLFLAVAPDAPGQPAMIHVGSLDSAGSTPLVESDSPALYAAPGYLLYMRGYTLVAQKFDADRLRVSGNPSPIVAQIDRLGGTGRAAFSVSQTGILAYRLMRENELIWLDRNGKRLGTVGRPGHQANPALSPDGRLMAIQRFDPASTSSSLWIIDLATGEERRFARESTDAGTPLWCADGRALVYRDGGRFYRRGLGAASGEVLVSGVTPQATPLGWVGGDRALLFDDRSAPSMLDLHLLPLEGARARAPLLHTAHDESQGQLSPDGRWLAYVSNETGRNAVYVRAFPLNGGAQLVTPDGGLEPRWRTDGLELYFLSPDRSLMAVPVSADPMLHLGQPARLFPTRLSTFLNGWFVRNQYVVTADGRFLINQPTDSDAPITVETNWTARLPR